VGAHPQAQSQDAEDAFQMLLRCQEMVGYKHHSDDGLERYSVKAHDNGIHVFRAFDALNNHRNMRRAMKIA